MKPLHQLSRPSRRHRNLDHSAHRMQWSKARPGFVGNLDWSRRKWGPPPGESECRVPLAVLKRNRLV
jgi:hypothetical protein